MDETQQITAELLGELPPLPQIDPRPDIRRLSQQIGRKVVVLDDDPTGTQTVHDVPIVTRWDVDMLEAELRDDSPVVYVLTNSRSLPERDAIELNREIVTHLRLASEAAKRDYAIVSRSDSTLRGHFPAELHAIEQASGLDFDAWILCPFFQEGGRLTIGDVHYVAEQDKLTPAAQTPFADDAAFGYDHSNLRDWVVEKSGGQIARSHVHSLSLEEIRSGDMEALTSRVMSLRDRAVCIINAVERRDMELAVAVLMRAEAAGRRFLYRTAASFVAVRSAIQPRPLLTPAKLRNPSGSGTLVVVGSYVPKTTEQLNCLLDSERVTAIELDAQLLLDPESRADQVKTAADRADRGLRANETVVIYTSRQIVHTKGEGSLAIGRMISDALIELLRRIETSPRLLIAKGGITSSDVATKACGIRRANVMGQILPGVPVWLCGDETRYAGMPLVIFPGNVGGPDALATAVSQAAT